MWLSLVLSTIRILASCSLCRACAQGSEMNQKIYENVYLYQAEDNLIDFSLWINNSARLGLTKSFKFDPFSFLIFNKIYFFLILHLVKGNSIVFDFLFFVVYAELAPKVRRWIKKYMNTFICYLHQAEDNLIDFSLWINNSATLGITKSFKFDPFSFLVSNNIISS